MKKLTLCAVLLGACMGAQAQTQQLFDNGWHFSHDGKTISVNLPHDWDISYAVNC